MRKFTIYNLQFTILIAILTFSFYILHSTFYIPTVLAVDSTPSADIKIKLQDFQKEIASKAAKLKQEISQKLQNKAYVGKIESKTNTSLTLSTKIGPKIITINQDTLQPKKLSPDAYVAALGDIDDTGVLTAKKIVLLDPTPLGGAASSAYTLNPKTYLWGQIVSITDNLITLRSGNFKNVAATLPPSNVKLNDFVILTGNFGKNNIFKAGFVYVIPQGGIIKPKKIATPSAVTRPRGQQTATTSAKPAVKGN